MELIYTAFLSLILAPNGDLITANADPAVHVD